MNNASETITIDTVRIKMSTYIWRDFQPITPPQGKPLRVKITLESDTPVSISKILQVIRVRLVTPDESWEVVLDKKTDLREQPGKLTFTLRNGPFWKPGEKVDVFVEVRGKDGNIRVLKAEQQTIQATF
ncbi:MAG: hypothetical protein GXO78_06575 [Calditrichaeota bacterium]|nr:hypothetical protein [Calditrichota bacterium]